MVYQFQGKLRLIKLKYILCTQLQNIRVNLAYKLISMQEDSPNTENYRPLNFNYPFTLSKAIRSWQDFAGTFLSIRFDESLNNASKEQVEVFWKKHLEQLCTENEKVCILVPAEISLNEANDESSETKKDGCTQKSGNKTHSKQKSKGKKSCSTPKMPLDKKIVEIAMDLVNSSYPTLDYDFASLYLGNQKQLLLFRKCYAIDNYIQKYRLPASFKEPLQSLTYLTDEFHYLKIQRNRAISTLNQSETKKLTEKITRLNLEINKEMASFSIKWKEILIDFRSKKKCRDLLVNNISAQLIALLRPMCHECETEIIDRFSECQSDQYKDILVVKKEDARLIPVDERIYDERVEEVRYVYVEPERQMQPPKDIRNLQFLGTNLKKLCYSYRVQLKHAEEWNKNQGLFIRSEPGETSYELNINLPPKCTSLDIDIYPYSMGKISYEIYLWNIAGFTKSTEKIVLFNELQLFNGKRQILKDKNVYLLGQSECGVKYSGNASEVQDQMVLFPYKAQNLSIRSSALICDELGDVASWGQMYYPQQDAKNDDSQPLGDALDKNYRIEKPSLLLGKKYIRKVSCGNGYYLMLSIFGSIYSMGANEYGQLGLGNFNEGLQNTEPHQICKFTNQASSFITDIKASYSGASFALNHRGEVYRWGFNQVDSTDLPIFDRFGSIINYSSIPIIYKWCDPHKISKNLIQEPIKQIQAGNGFYFALSEDGVLYGWGICKFLDVNEKIVIDIVNPIVIMKNIALISTNSDHTIAITIDNKILAWGNLSNFSNKQEKFVNTPLDFTAQFEDITNIKAIKAGKTFTAIVTKQNKLKIIGKTTKFTRRQYQFSFDIADIVCGDEQLIGILAIE